MMQLILVRHGEAGRQFVHDAERTLTALGEQQAASIAQQVLERYSPDRLICSPLLRAQQTMQAFARLCPEVPVQQVDGIKPEDDPAQALMALAALEGRCIVVVCHMDIIARMAALLLEDWPQPFGLAEARVLEMPVISAGMATERERLWPVAGESA